MLSTFFVEDLYQILLLFQNLLGLWHSYLGPQPLWTSLWQDWKSLLMKLHKSIFELEIWQGVKYFFRRRPISNIISVSELTRIMTLLLRTSTDLNKSLTRLKIPFMKLQKSIFELESWQRVKYFFRRWPISNITSVSEPTRIMTLLLRTSTDLNKSMTRLKITFHETAQEYLLSSKFDNVLSTVFVDDLIKCYLCFRTQ